jgi:thioredoxin 1
MILNITETDFEVEVIQAGLPVLVEFASKTCMPCRVLLPILEELSEEYEDEVKFCKVDLTESLSLGLKLGIEILPTLVLFNNGGVVDQLTGLQSKEKIEDLLNETLDLF